MPRQKAIVIGASSGIGRELAKILSRNNYLVGVAARRIDLLTELQKELPGKTFIKQIDVTKAEEATRNFKELIADMGGVDLVVFSSGYGDLNRDLDWQIEKETIDVNVAGFTLIAGIAFQFFLAEGAGHLVGISSIAALRGLRSTPSYSASKAYVSNYLEALRLRAFRLKKPVFITDIKPGFVRTAMSKGNNLFWVATPQKAAAQIYDAIRKRKSHAYVTKRWRLFAWLMKTMPDWLYQRL